MRFKVERKLSENIHNYPTTDVELVQDFSNRLKGELGEFLVSVVLFGSAARNEASGKSDIDVLVIINDLDFQLTNELQEAYKIIVENIIYDTSTRLHVTSMTHANFWEYSRVGDPIVINILRDGAAIMDENNFNPLQLLLKQGRIKPSEESVWRYFGRAPRTLINSRWHILQATLDLYWACIDSAHSALMKANIMPPTPEHVADLLDKQFAAKGKLKKKYVKSMRKFYNISKRITHRDVKNITGAEFDKLLKEAREFVDQMKFLIESL